jgi:uncharacterized protein YndB with AHSA1/START domain
MADSSAEPGTDAGGAEEGVVITRRFDAPRDLVFHALTEPEHLRHWWGPTGFTWVTCTMDLRPRGTFLYCMRSPDGREMWGKWVFREIVPPERLVFVNSFADARGAAVRAPFNADWPLEILNILTLTEHEGTTTLTLRGEPINATARERETFEDGRPSVRRGFAGTWDQLDAYLREIMQAGGK